MPQISQKTKDKISEQILHYLFSIAPESAFTVKIATEIARDEEFTKDMLHNLEKKSLVVQIKKNINGEDYQKRRRWRLSNQAFEVFKQRQK